jgi:hypothetical protein
MGFFSGIRRRVKKLIPKEIRPALPFIMAAAPIPGLGSLASRGLADQFLKAALTKAATDDEAGIKDILRTAAIAAAPQAVGKGLGSLAPRFASRGTDTEMFKMLTGAEKALSPGGGFKQAAKIAGGQAATDFGIKQAELNEKAIEEYNRNLLEKGVRDKTARRSAIFNIFVNAGYDDDEVNVMLDKYGYKRGGRAGRMMRGTPIMTDAMRSFFRRMDDKVMVPRKKPVDSDDDEIEITDDEQLEIIETVDKDGKKEKKTRITRKDDLMDNLSTAMSGIETAYGRPFGNMEPVPMLRFAQGGDVDDDVLETEEEIITPEYLMKEEGVAIGPQVSAPDKMDSLNQLSLMLFNKPIFELTEEQFEMLKEFAADRAAMQVGYEPGKYSDEEIEMYENYKYNMNEQRPGMPIIDIDEFLRMEYGAARLGVAKGGPIKTQKPNMEKDTKGKMAAPDYYIKRMEELMDLGYDYETAGRIAMDYDEYREAIDKGPVGDAYKQGGVIKKKKIIAIGTGKLKDYPGIKKILEMNKKGKKRFSKAEGGSSYSFEDYLREREMLDKKGNMERLRKEYKEDMRRKKVKEQKTMAKDGGLMNLAGNELDLRGGGFVPMGKKEKADDVPARLSKNEFVFTADAVRAAGGGSVQKGADLMYDTMKKLEAQS